MVAANLNLSLAQSAQPLLSVEKIKQGRLSSLGSSLVLLAETVERAALACLALIAVVLSLGFWQKAADFAGSQMQKAKVASSQSLDCFIAVFSPQKLHEPEIHTALRPKEIELCSPIETELSSPIASPRKSLTGEERENRMRQGADLIQRKLKQEFTFAQKQMKGEKDYGPFFYQIGALGSPETEIIGPYQVGICHAQGRRPTMEDEHLTATFNLEIGGTTYPVQLFGIFDGHGGVQAAQYLKTHLGEKLKQKLLELNPQKLSDEGIWNALKMTFVEMNKEFQEESGSTATVALSLDGKLWTANVGDSRTILVKRNGEILQLTEDAKPSDPRYVQGIKNRGGYVQLYDCWRVNGILAVGRAFGDHGIGPGMSTRPKITQIPLNQIPAGSHLVLACDGIWDVASTRQIALSACFNHSEDQPTALAQNIVYSAYQAGSTDNLSAMVVQFR